MERIVDPVVTPRRLAAYQQQRFAPGVVDEAVRYTGAGGKRRKVARLHRVDPGRPGQYPNALTKEEVAASALYEGNGGGFNNALSRLRTLELVQGRSFGQATTCSMVHLYQFRRTLQYLPSQFSRYS
jgi:hypothetical protein